MSYYVFGTNISYQDYLQARSFSQDITSATREAGHRVSMEVSRQTREVIASDQALAREGIAAMEIANQRLSSTLSDGLSDLSSTIDEGFTRLSYDLQGISTGVSELNVTFHWGFGQMIAGIGRMNDALSELIKTAKTPAQTAAYEQYEIARDAFRQGLYPECIEALDKAISGDHTSSGYKLEWRFHQMKGTIQLGFAEGDLSLMDQNKAEETFLLAARYAKADYPEHAGQAFLSAGWAAYCQGKMKEALADTEQAISVHPSLGEAFFQAAKVHMALGDVDEALPMLGRAIDLDRLYALKAAGDGDFQKHDNDLRAFLEALRAEKYRQSVPIAQAALEELKPWRENSTDTGLGETFRLIDAFLADGSCWPLFDMLALVESLGKTIAYSKSLPIVVTIKGSDRTHSYEETYPVMETYQEEIITKPGGFFRKAVTEVQTKSRTINKTRTVTETFPGPTTQIELCYIPAGTFIMGEGSLAHKVTLSHDFYIGKYPVTQAQYEAVMGDNPSNFKGADRPVEQVSWGDCQRFIKKLNDQAGEKAYQLPTEAMWEYACRAGSTNIYSFGDDEGRLGEYGWYENNSGKKTHPVGQKKPNAWGLFDIHGNVMERCQDYYADYTDGPVTDPKGPSASEFGGRVCRGGCWDSAARRCQSGDRDGANGDRSFFIGFRLARKAQ